MEEPGGAGAKSADDLSERQRVAAERRAEVVTTELAAKTQREAREAAAAAHRQQEIAIEAERARVAKISAGEVAGRIWVEANKARRAKVREEARDVIAYTLNHHSHAIEDYSAIATDIVKAIIAGKVPGVKIEY